MLEYQQFNGGDQAARSDFTDDCDYGSCVTYHVGGAVEVGTSTIEGAISIRSVELTELIRG